MLVCVWTVVGMLVLGVGVPGWGAYARQRYVDLISVASVSWPFAPATLLCCLALLSECLDGISLY